MMYGLLSGGLGLVALRLVLAAIFIVHALPKVKSPDGMAAWMKWSKTQVQALGTVEIIAALAVATGIAMRLGALAMMVVMVGAIYTKTQKGKVSFMAHDKTGWELDLLVLASALTVYGSGGFGWGMMHW